MMAVARRRLTTASLLGLLWVCAATAIAEGTSPAPTGEDFFSKLFSGAGGQAIVCVWLWSEQRKLRDEVGALKMLIHSRPCVISEDEEPARSTDEPCADHRHKRRGRS